MLIKMASDFNPFIGLTDLGSHVFRIMGGAPEDEGAEGVEDAEVDDAAGGAEDTEVDDYVPPTKEQFERMQAGLKKANREAAQRRHWLDENGFDPRTGKPYDPDADEDAVAEKPAKVKKRKDADDEDETPVGISPAEYAKMQKQARIDSKRAAQKEARLMSALGKTAAKSALADAGWNGKGASVIERMIDPSEIEIGDDGEIIGLDEQIADIKADMPEWFKQARAPRRVKPAGSSADVDGADKSSAKPAAEPVGWLQRLENQFQGVDE